jgi:plastocyanin
MRVSRRPSAAFAALAVVAPLPLGVAGHHKHAKHHHKAPAHLSSQPSHASAAAPPAPATSSATPATGTSGTTTLPAAPAGSTAAKRPAPAGAPAKHELQSGTGRGAAARFPVTRFAGRTPGFGSSHTPRSSFRKQSARKSRAHAAGDPTDVISDFKFSPGSITVHAGDTITWVNDGPTAHSATASDKSFDTGVLQKGASASHTFAQAGTFAYVCKIHPFMHGTVVVLASTTTPSSGSGSSSNSPSATGASSSPSTAAPAASATSDANGLPNTGFDAAAALLTGVGLLGAGYAVRRRARTR